MKSKILLSHLSAKLNSHCIKKKLNKSSARDKILEAIVEEGGHFTKATLLKRLQNNHPEVGQATLYRNLPIFLESDLIQEGPKNPSGQTLYELSHKDHHDHLVCMVCEEIVEFFDKSIESRQMNIAKKYGFQITMHTHVIYGVCNNCSKK